MTITTDNYEEYFYRYCEGELTPAQCVEVECFAAAHPELAEELSLYDPQLKLEAETVEYSPIEPLIKKAPVVFPLWRWAVAACVAGALVTGAWVLWPDQQQSAPMLAQKVDSIATVKPIRVERQQIQTPVLVAKANKVAAPVQPKVEEEHEAFVPEVEAFADDLMAEATPVQDVAIEEDDVVIMIEVPIIEGQEFLADVYVAPDKPTREDYLEDFRRTCVDLLRSSYLRLRGEAVAYLDEKFNS